VRPVIPTADRHGLTVSARVYGLLLQLYPVRYRREYGPLMMQTFCDLTRDAYTERGLPELTRVWAHTLADVASTVVTEHIDEWFNNDRQPDFSMPAVEVHHISKSFANWRGQLKPVLSDIDLTVQSGEFVSVLGPTGCGKTTLLGVIAGLVRPTGGQVSVMGQPVQSLSRHVGYLFQKDALFPWQTILNNVLAGPLFRGLDLSQAVARAHEWIGRVGLSGFENFYPYQLSGGMRKRAALAQSLITEPDVLLMDEPFGDLDVQTRTIMEEELLDLCATTRVSVVYVTHDIEAAIRLAERVVVLTAAPAHVRALYESDIAKPRRTASVRFQNRFVELYQQIRSDLRSEVLKNYECI